MDLEKDFNCLVLKLFWARPKSEFGEHLATQASNNAWKTLIVQGSHGHGKSLKILEK